MAEKQKINELLQETIAKVRELGNAETIIGKPISVGDVTVIPVSKLSCGLAAGGSDYASKNSASSVMFGGGGGAGVEVTPLSFIVVRGDRVEILPASGTVAAPVPMTDYVAIIEKAVDALPGIVDRLQEFVDRQKEKKAAKAAESEITVSEKEEPAK
ncbi:MAG: spore germination protein GerW family protein [Clostridiales bacterium]|nr:spore germination protein GerW family protein [Clostridiales bacterium]